jgi:hypothetical protein
VSFEEDRPYLGGERHHGEVKPEAGREMRHPALESAIEAPWRWFLALDCFRFRARAINLQCDDAASGFVIRSRGLDSQDLRKVLSMVDGPMGTGAGLTLDIEFDVDEHSHRVNLTDVRIVVRLSTAQQTAAPAAT